MFCDVCLALLEGRLRLTQGGHGLLLGRLGVAERRLERPRIDLEQELSFLHGVAFPVPLCDEIPLHLGADGGVDGPIRGGDPFRIDRQQY